VRVGGVAPIGVLGWGVFVFGPHGWGVTLVS
jgi:hypothetical protein